jgi:glycine/D-amino acid oxidase-like deaminating enzyme
VLEVHNGDMDATSDRPHPFWMPDVPDPEARGEPPSRLPDRVDVVVVGAGIAGGVAALLLARAGASVALLDGRAPGRGATGRSAGFLIRGTADHPDRVAAAIGRERALALWRFTADSVELLVRLLDEERIDCALRRDGGLVLALDEDERRSVEASAGFLGEGELWSAAEVEHRAGFVDATAGWFRHQDGVLDPFRLAGGLAAAAERHGACVATGVTVHAIEDSPGGATVRTDRGDIVAGTTLLAVNSALPMLEPRFRDTIQPVRAQMHATAPAAPGSRLPWPVYAHHGFEYWRQEPSGELLFGGCRWAAEAGRECGVTDDAHVSPLIHEVQRAFVVRHLPAFADLPARQCWTGIMAFTPDGLPLVGAVPGAERRLVCVGWNGHGLALAPLSAALVVDGILGRPGARPPRMFDPGRSL